MTTIQLMACIGMVVGFFVLLGITPSDFTEGVFRQITSKPKSLRDEINESTQRKKKFVLRREIEESQNILRMTGREAKFPAICAMSLLLFLVGASFAFLLGNFFLVPVLAAGMMFIPFWYIKLTAAYFKKAISAELETALSIIMAGDFEESLDYGDIYGRLDALLNLTNQSGYHVQYTEDGKMEFRVWDLSVDLQNASFASADSAGNRLIADCEIELEVPVSFGGRLLPPMRMTVKVSAGYTPRF